MEILLSLVILIVVIGIVYWIASLFLPEPVPKIVLVVGVLVLLFWLVGHADSLDVGNGR